MILAGGLGMNMNIDNNYYENVHTPQPKERGQKKKEGSIP